MGWEIWRCKWVIYLRVKCTVVGRRSTGVILLALPILKSFWGSNSLQKKTKFSDALTLSNTWDIMSIDIFSGSRLWSKIVFLCNISPWSSILVFLKANSRDYKVKMWVKWTFMVSHTDFESSFSFIFTFGAIFCLSFSPLGFFWLEKYIIAFLPTFPSKRICFHPQALLNRWA